MAINLLSGFNWNEARKGYREGEIEDQNDAQFLEDQRRREMMNQQLAAQMAFEDQRRPLVLQQMQQQGQLGALNLLDATRRNDLGAAQQPGALALADVQGRYRTALADSLPVELLARQAGQTQAATADLRLAQTQDALKQLPLRSTLTNGQLISEINLQPARTALAGDQLRLAGQQTALQSDQTAAEASLLPARTQATAQQIATGNLLSQLSGEQAQANQSLLGPATQARAAEIQERLRILAQQSGNADRRVALANLSDIMANPDAIATLAANEGMDPVTYLDQMSAIMTQQATSLNILAGGAVNTGELTPRTREEAMLQRMIMAGRTAPQRPQVYNVRAPTQAAGRAGAAGAAGAAINPVTGLPPSGAPAQAGPAAPAAPAAQQVSQEDALLQSLFPTSQAVQQAAQQRQATAALPKPPPLPAGVRPDDVKELSRQTNWGGFSTDDLSRIMQGGGSAGYSQAQIAAAGQELYRRRLEQLRSGQQ